MYINSDEQADAKGDSVRQDYSMMGDPPTLSHADDDGPPLGGTIDATVAVQDPHFYGNRSQMLIASPSLSLAPAQRPARKVSTRAKDLIDELQTINDQIHRIMFQVERAVSRLATN